MKLGSGAIKAQIYVIGETDTKKDGASLIALGYDHSLSKNTMVYADYAMVNNDTGASFSASGAGHGDSAGVSAAGKDPSALSLGLKVKF
jgi:predicted porin